MRTVNYVRPYLFNLNDGRVVWSQYKAYQDTPGLAMWIDLVMGPARVASGSPKWGLIWDNCAAHLVPAVKEVFAQWCIHVFEFPPQMTALLHLIYSGPMKAHTKSERARSIYSRISDVSH